MKRLIFALALLPLPAFAFPQTCPEAVSALIADLGPDEKAAFLEMERAELAEHRDGFGAGIAAEFDLVNGNPALSESCSADYAFPESMSAADRTHPYSIAMIIMERVWDRLHDVPGS